MNVFIIPSWHPTVDKPNWCNWIKPHIQIAKLIAQSITILQVDQESSENNDIIKKIGLNHYYMAAGIKKNRANRTILMYEQILDEYFEKLEQLYLHAIQKNNKPDIIHAHVSMPAGYAAGLLGKKYNIPVIVTEHYSGFFSDNKYPWRLRSFYKKMSNNIDGLYAVSPGFKDKIERKTKIKVNGITFNPVNTELFKPIKNKITNNKVQFVSTGNFGQIKGTDILLKAFADLPTCYDWHLTIVGKKPTINLEYWNKLIQKVPSDKLSLIDPTNQLKLRDIYSSSDVYIVSSRLETANISMLEAMACGCFVLCNKIEGPETLLSQNVSLIFENKNEGLLESLKKIFQTELPNRQFMINFVETNYSISAIQKSISELYKSVIFKFK